MKTFAIFLLSTILSLSGRAQQLINQKDAFSGKQIKAASIMLGGTFKNIGQMFGFAESDNKKYIDLSWMPGMSGANVDGYNFDMIDIKKCSILLKMDDDAIVKFKADSLLSKKTGAGMSAMLNIGAYITDEQLKLLMEHTIKTIRLGLTDDNAGVDAPFFNDKLRKQVQKAAAFMLNVN